MKQLHHSLFVEVRRGSHLESFHQVEACLIRAKPDESLTFGNVQRALFPRSTLKLIQALPLVSLHEHGEISTEELALSCASHRGEAAHLRVARNWAQRLGLTDQTLVCGFHPPGSETEFESFILSHQEKSRFYNNCAGKHLGFCHWSLRQGYSVIGYWEPTHPSQIEFFGRLKALLGLKEILFAKDGCGVPNPLLSLKQLAEAYWKWLALPEANAILQSVRTHPALISGTDGMDTWILEQSGGHLISKTGAEGVYLLLHPAEGLVLTLKALDGNARASQAALLHFIQKLGLGGESFQAAVKARLGQPLKNWAGESTGQILVQGLEFL